jgi:hypothetical protein
MKLVRIVPAACCLVLLSLPGPNAAVQRFDNPDSEAPDCYVLSVGVDNYATAAKLQGCLNDARDIAARFVAQQGKRFGKVSARVLLDAQASREAVTEGLDGLAAAARSGDFAVLFFSGHGGRTPQRDWYFLPHDYDPNRHSDTAVTDRDILDCADDLINRGLTVFVIVDACSSGQLRLRANAALNRVDSPAGGGLVLMVSSAPSQTSAALGDYSAFARAVVEGLSGEADLDGDGFVTLREVRRYAFARTYRLLAQRGMKQEQDGECDWSLSVREDLRLAVAKKRSAPPPSAEVVWSGVEGLAGYGKLAFRFLDDRRVVMEDRDGSTEGAWELKRNTVTLRFYNGSVVYTGTLRQAVLSGTATNGRTTWSWTVTRQAPSGVVPPGAGPVPKQ